jgi:hypothetical protein
LIALFTNIACFGRCAPFPVGGAFIEPPVIFAKKPSDDQMSQRPVKHVDPVGLQHRRFL